jgi:CopG family transcriptional regulator/antitoxin EndoAI
VRRRINISLPEDTVRLIDRVAERGARSQLIELAVHRYVAETGRANLRTRLREGARKRATRDLDLVEEWFQVDSDEWRREPER